MLRSLLSAAVVLLLIGNILLAGCVACSGPQPVAERTHACCSRHGAPMTGHCGEKAPASSSCDSNTHAVPFDKADATHSQPAAPAVIADVPQMLVPAESRADVLRQTPDSYSPPPLFVLHASFLI